MKRQIIFLLSFLMTTPVFAAEKMTLLLDWFVNPDHAPIIVAREKGFFADQGLEVEVIAPADPSDPPKLVAAGKAELAISYQPQIHLQVAEGLPLIRVGTLVSTPLNCLLVLKDGPIKKISDLKGKKVGFSVAGVKEALFAAAQVGKQFKQRHRQLFVRHHLRLLWGNIADCLCTMLDVHGTSHDFNPFFRAFLPAPLKPPVKLGNEKKLLQH